MKKTSLIILISFALFLAACSSSKNSAQKSKGNSPNRQGPPSVEEIFKMDKNGDGRLAKSELNGPLLNDFNKIDADSDGFLSRDEVKNAPKPKRGGPRN